MVGSGLASTLEPKVRSCQSYHDHRATALRFCWSTRGRKRSGFHACSGSPEQSGASGATKTTARPRSASVGRAVVGSWSASTCAPNRCTVRRVHTQLPTTAQPRSASVDTPVVGSGLASNENEEPHLDLASDHRATALRFCGHTCGRKRSGFHARPESPDSPELP